MSKLAWIDAFSGVAGNMLLAACIDAGAELEPVERELARLELGADWSLHAEPVVRHGLRALHLDVRCGDSAPARTLGAVEQLLAAAKLPARVEQRSLAVFRKLFEAEARVHGRPLGEVHLHECGAVDAVIDIVGCVLALEQLRVERLVCSELPLGAGELRASHGPLPVPAPAVAELLRGAPVRGGPVPVELVTPTGAALVTTLAESWGPLPAMRLSSLGVGAGDRELPGRANLIRLLVGEGAAADAEALEHLYLSECHLDDVSPQLLGYLCELLLERGALDVGLVPMTMKKGRPGQLLRVLAPPERADQLEQLVLDETGSLGIRRQLVERRRRARASHSVDTDWGPVRIKLGWDEGSDQRARPEYEDLRAAARKHGVTLSEVEQAALEAWRKRQSG